MRSYRYFPTWLNHARWPLACSLVWLSSQTPTDFVWAREPEPVVRAQSESLGVHEPRFSSTLKAWCDCLHFKPSSTYYGRGFANWTRHHQSRLPAVPPLYEAEFGFRPTCWRQLPVSACRRDPFYPAMEVGPPAHGVLPGSQPEPIQMPTYENTLMPPPAPPVSIELAPGAGSGPESVPPPPVLNETPEPSSQNYNNLFNQPTSQKSIGSAVVPVSAVSVKGLNWRRDSTNSALYETQANRLRWYSAPAK